VVGTAQQGARLVTHKGCVEGSYGHVRDWLSEYIIGLALVLLSVFCLPHHLSHASGMAMCLLLRSSMLVTIIMTVFLTGATCTCPAFATHLACCL
jgi:hypothetical protein